MKELKENILQSALMKDVNFQLSDRFSEQIIQKILQKAKQEKRYEIIAIVTVGILFLIALGVTISLTDFKFSLGALTFLSDHIGLISFAILFIGFLHLIDKKLVRRQQVN